VSFLITLIVILFTVSCGGSDRDAVISVGDRDLYPSDINHVLEEVRGDSAEVDQLVSSIVGRELILQDAWDRGIYDDDETQRVLYEKEREILTSSYYGYILSSVQASEDTVRALYDQLGTRLWYTKMVCDDSLTADSLRTLALSGHDFAQLVAENTIDPFYQQTGGRNTDVDLMLTPPDDMEQLAMLALEGISSPSQIPSGWMIIRLDSTASVPPEPWEEFAPILENYIGAHLREEYKIFLEDSLRVAHNLTVVPGTGELISSYATDMLGNHAGYSEEDASKIAYTFDGGDRSVIWLANNIRGMPGFLPRDAMDAKWVEDYCLTLGLYDIMRVNAIEAGLDTVPETAIQINRNRSRYILDIYHADVIAPRIEVTDELMLRLFEENLDRFMLPEGRVFSTVSAVGEDQVDLLEGIISRDGDPFERIDDLTPSQSILAPGESLLTRPISLEDVPERFQDLLFGADYDEVVVCTISETSRIAFRLEEELPERPNTFEAVENQLRNMAKLELEEVIVLGLVDSLKALYAPVIDWDYFRMFYEPVASDEESPDQDGF
jgi:hypothetical protein